MANLRTHKNNGNYDEELKKQLKKDIENVVSEMSDLSKKREKLERELLELEIKPFKIGGYALAEISSGRSKKWQKCLLECVNGYLYARPVKEDGELSGRHFSIILFGEQKYSDFLKEVK